MKTLLNKTKKISTSLKRGAFTTIELTLIIAVVIGAAVAVGAIVYNILSDSDNSEDIEVLYTGNCANGETDVLDKSGSVIRVSPISTTPIHYDTDDDGAINAADYDPVPTVRNKERSFKAFGAIFNGKPYSNIILRLGSTTAEGIPNAADFLYKIKSEGSDIIIEVSVNGTGTNLSFALGFSAGVKDTKVLEALNRQDLGFKNIDDIGCITPFIR